jgi:hypothetical protein
LVAAASFEHRSSEAAELSGGTITLVVKFPVLLSVRAFWRQALAAVECASKVFETMPKSKASESTEQELATMKMDMEGMNTRQEETGGKVDTVQNLMTELTDKFSRLEAMFIASMEKQTAIPEKELTKDKPSSSGEQNELTWYEGPPHWRRRTDTEAPPRYEYYSQDTQEMHNSYTEYHDPRRTTQPHSEP